MPDVSILIILIVIAALAFDFINGFHDTANAIATVVSTRVLTPRTAIIMAAVLNFIGAVCFTKVADTFSSGLVTGATQTMVLAAIIGAITWNLITWYFGIPSSSSHALVGGVVGAAAVNAGWASIIWNQTEIDKKTHAIKHVGLLPKVLIPLLTSPLMGFALGFLIMTTVYVLFARAHPRRVGNKFRALQILSAATMAFAHGTNDAQKSMGIITLALFSGKHLADKPAVPLWVKLACAIAMAAGTSAGGWRIISTMGHKIIRLEPVHGFAAETAASLVILYSTFTGATVSTTHVISGSIFGVGAARRLKAVNWSVAQRMIIAWVLTIPASALVAALAYFLLNSLGVK